MSDNWFDSTEKLLPDDFVAVSTTASNHDDTDSGNPSNSKTLDEEVALLGRGAVTDLRDNNSKTRSMVMLTYSDAKGKLSISGDESADHRHWKLMRLAVEGKKGFLGNWLTNQTGYEIPGLTGHQGFIHGYCLIGLPSCANEMTADYSNFTKGENPDFVCIDTMQSGDIHQMVEELKRVQTDFEAHQKECDKDCRPKMVTSSTEGGKIIHKTWTLHGRLAAAAKGS